MPADPFWHRAKQGRTSSVVHDVCGGSCLPDGYELALWLVLLLLLHERRPHFALSNRRSYGGRWLRCRSCRHNWVGLGFHSRQHGCHDAVISTKCCRLACIWLLGHCGRLVGCCLRLCFSCRCCSLRLCLLSLPVGCIVLLLQLAAAAPLQGAPAAAVGPPPPGLLFVIAIGCLIVGMHLALPLPQQVCCAIPLLLQLTLTHPAGSTVQFTVAVRYRPHWTMACR